MLPGFFHFLDYNIFRRRGKVVLRFLFSFWAHLLFMRWGNIHLTVFVWRTPWTALLLTQTRFRSEKDAAVLGSPPAGGRFAKCRRLSMVCL